MENNQNNNDLKRIVKNVFIKSESGIEICEIVNKSDIFGVEVSRIKIPHKKIFTLKNDEGYIVSILQGKGTLKMDNSNESLQNLKMEEGTHCFIPLNKNALFESDSEILELIYISSLSNNVVGDKFIIKNSKFLKIASGLDNSKESYLLRWVLTSQYLSRRIFLQHEKTLISKIGYPVSWNNTTMFDCSGLPVNNENLPVFKMSYNNNTEINCCYHVPIESKVRFAKHPYSNNLNEQKWENWESLDNNTTYILNETEKEGELIEVNGIKKLHRNKHEIFIPKNSYVSLYCMFDPGLVGIEKHIKGEYSDYASLSETKQNNFYNEYVDELIKSDKVIESLSLDYASGKDFEKNEFYSEFLKRQSILESIEKNLMKENQERENVIKAFSSNNN